MHKKVQALQLASHLNMAMCHLKLQVFSAATENSNKAQEMDSNDETGLVHEGEAHPVGDAQEGPAALPSNKAAEVQLAMCPQQIHKQPEARRSSVPTRLTGWLRRRAKGPGSSGCRTAG